MSVETNEYQKLMIRTNYNPSFSVLIPGSWDNFWMMGSNIFWSLKVFGDLSSTGTRIIHVWAVVAIYLKCISCCLEGVLRALGKGEVLVLDHSKSKDEEN